MSELENYKSFDIIIINEIYVFFSFIIIEKNKNYEKIKTYKRKKNKGKK